MVHTACLISNVSDCQKKNTLKKLGLVTGTNKASRGKCYKTFLSVILAYNKNAEITSVKSFITMAQAKRAVGAA